MNLIFQAVTKRQLISVTERTFASDGVRTRKYRRVFNAHVTRSARLTLDISHPTRVKLLGVVDELLAQRSPASITSEEVLAISGVSKGSLYHHFEDFADLIETALARQFSGVVNERVRMVEQAVRSASTRSDVLALIRNVTIAVEEDGSRPIRANRISLLALTRNNPRLLRKIAREQQRLTDAFDAAIRDGQARGLMRADVDSYALAVLLQAWSLGKALDDVAERQVDSQIWAELITTTFERAFL